MYVCVLLFFFCKQKTAYEVRISDWSSDVCSSDLVVDQRLVEVVSLGKRELEHDVLVGSDGVELGEDGVAQELLCSRLLRAVDVDLGLDDRHQAAGQEIGRASCRERVCLYG